MFRSEPSLQPEEYRCRPLAGVLGGALPRPQYRAVLWHRHDYCIGAAKGSLADRPYPSSCLAAESSLASSSSAPDSVSAWANR